MTFTSVPWLMVNLPLPPLLTVTICVPFIALAVDWVQP